MLAISFLRRAKHSSDEIVRTLSSYNIAPDLSQRLGDYLLKAEDRALLRFNPAYLARTLELPRRQGLELMSAATRAGLVDLNWEVQCPMCGGQGPAFAGLRTARSSFSCGMCSNHFDAHLDDEMHITFTVNERIRSLGKDADDPKWRQQIDQELKPVSSHELLTLQVFRDMFVNEPLPDGESFQVRWMALMFTDLGGSTGIYARKGDPRAYGLVRAHFRLVFGAVTEAGGAVVKTIGDAVMAVFPDSDLALQAALASQAAVARYNVESQLSSDEQLLLKIGLHAGPTLAVTLNDRLDYFGTTVNAAARVQALAHNCETVLTQQVLDSPGVRALLPAELAGETLTLRGLDDQPFEVFRLISESTSRGAS